MFFRNPLKITGGVVLVLVVIAIGFYAVLMNNAALQNSLFKRAIDMRLVGTQDQFGGDKLDVLFCGTASPMGVGRAQQCVAVLAGDKFFIIDTGARSAEVAGALGLPMGRLNGVLLTHFHSDHIAALGEMHLVSWVRGRPEKLAVYGGSGIAKVVDGFNMVYGQDYQYRTVHHGADIMPPRTAGLVARMINPQAGKSEIIYHDDSQTDGLTISAFIVPHPPIEPAYGYRFDYRGRSVVISGDTARSDNLVRAAKGADVLVHEVLQPDMVRLTSQALAETGQNNLSQLLLDTLTYHTTPREAAEVANKAGAELLVFSHYAPVPQNRLMERMFARGAHEVRPEGVFLARDGSHISLPVGSDAIIVK